MPMYERPGAAIDRARAMKRERDRYRESCENLVVQHTQAVVEGNEARAECDRLREALLPFAFIGREFMEPLGLGDEYDHARELLGLNSPSEEHRP